MERAERAGDDTESEPPPIREDNVGRQECPKRCGHWDGYRAWASADSELDDSDALLLEPKLLRLDSPPYSAEDDAEASDNVSVAKKAEKRAQKQKRKDRNSVLCDEPEGLSSDSDEPV